MSNIEIKIHKLRFPENIRATPGMYIGQTRNPEVLFREIVDNSLDELINNRATYINIENKERFICVDDGAGIPVYMDDDDNTVSIIESIFTDAHTGSKFNNISDEFTIGTHGIGTKAGNALSESFCAYVNIIDMDINRLPRKYHKQFKKGNYIFNIEYRKGILHLDKLCSALPENIQSLVKGDNWSTAISIVPDKDVFDTIHAELDTISLSIIKLQNPECNISYNGKDIEKLKNTTVFPNKFIQNKCIDMEVNVGDNKFTMFFGYSAEDFEYKEFGSVNAIVSSGYHVKSIQTALCRALSKKVPKINENSFKYGLRLFVLLFAKKPQYSSQSKERLTKIEDITRSDIIKAFTEAFDNMYEDNIEYFTQVCTQLFDYIKEIGKLSMKDYVDEVVIKGDNRKKLNGMGVEVYDATSRNRKECELFIVEGKSAAGSLLQARDIDITAVLPLRGKPLNATKVSELDKILKNKEIRTMINVIGASITPFTDIKTIRYGKIILTADPDPDGKAINALLLGTFAVLLPELIENGNIYIVDIPLYKQAGKFIYDRDKLDTKKQFTRFKGLGECNPEELHTMCIDKKTRKLIHITNENIDKAIHLVKMGPPKKELMCSQGIVV